jgi:hypothetical protein
MSNSQPSVQNRKFLVLASLIIMLSAGLAASAWPAVLSFGRTQSSNMAVAGKRATGDEARLDYRLAYILDPSNQAAAVSVATSQQTAGKPDEALKILENAGQGREADRVRIKAALETGNVALTEATANRLSAAGAADDDLVLAALAYDTVGKPERIDALKARITAPQALQDILRANGSKVTLAIALRATGLPISSRRILETVEASVPRNLLLASLIKANEQTTDLPVLAKLYREAISLDPTSTVARGELIAVLREQKDDSAADTEQALLDRLKSGRP